MKTFRRISVGITTYLAILRRQISKLSGRRLSRFIQKLRERSLNMVWRYTVEAVKNGKVIGRRTGIGLNTNNWGTFLAVALSSPPAGGSILPQMKAVNGTSYNINFWNTTTSALFNNSTYTTSAYVQLGTGTTAATRADYALQAPIAGTSTINFAYPGTSPISSTVSVSYSTAQTPSELGLFLGWNTGSAAQSFMIDHAVFSALPASTGFNVTYSLSLS